MLLLLLFAVAAAAAAAAAAILTSKQRLSKVKWFRAVQKPYAVCCFQSKSKFQGSTLPTSQAAAQ